MDEQPEAFGLEDPLYPQAAAALPVDEAMPVSFLQRRLHIGYYRAVRLKEAIRGKTTHPNEPPALKERHDSESV